MKVIKANLQTRIYQGVCGLSRWRPSKKENKSYTESENMLLYEIRENSITIVLPILEEKTDLNEDEKQVYNLIKRKTMSSSEILADLDFGKTKTVKIINRLIEKGYIVALGNGRSKKYTVR